MISPYLIPSITFLALAFLVGFIGNSLVLFVYWRKLSVTPLKILYRVLALFGLLSTVVIIPGKTFELLNQWDYAHHIVCKAIKYISAAATIGSGLVLLAIAVTRYRKICRPFGKQVSLTQVKVITASIVITSLLCASPYGLMVGRQSVIRNGTSIYVCDVGDVYFHNNYMTYNTIFFTFVFLSAAVPSFVLYFLIWKKARKHSRNLWNKLPLVDTNHGNIESGIEMTPTPASEADKENRAENISVSRQNGGEAGNLEVHVLRDVISCGERQNRVTNFSNSVKEKDKEDDCVEDCIQRDVIDLNMRSRVSQGPTSDQLVCREVVSGGHAVPGSADRCKVSSGRSPSRELDAHHGTMTASGPSVASGELSLPERTASHHTENKRVRPQRAASGTDEQQTQNVNTVKADLNVIQNFHENSPRIVTIDRTTLLVPGDPSVDILDLPAGLIETRHETADPVMRQTELGRTTFLLLVICSKFVVSFFPFLACEFYRSVYHDTFKGMGGTSEALFKLFYLSFLITGSANAIVYSLCDVNFRRECYKLFCRRSLV